MSKRKIISKGFQTVKDSKRNIDKNHLSFGELKKQLSRRKEDDEPDISIDKMILDKIFSHIQKNDFNLAMSYCDLLLEAKYSSVAIWAKVYLFKGICFSSMKDHEQALIWYDDSLYCYESIDTSTKGYLEEVFNVYMNMMQSQIALGLFKEACFSLEVAIGCDTKTSVHPFLSLSYCYRKLGEFKTALHYSIIALDIEQTERTKCNLVQTLVEMNKIEGFNNSEKLKFLYQLADQVSQSGEIKTGKYYASSTYVFVDQESQKLNNKAVIYLDKEKDYDKALITFDKALRIEPNNYLAWHNRGLALHRLERLNESILSFEKALEIYKGDIDVWHELGLVQQKLGNYQSALTSFEKGLELSPTDYKCWKGMGFALLDIGNTQKAEFCFSQGRKMNPNIVEELSENKDGRDFVMIGEKNITYYKNKK